MIGRGSLSAKKPRVRKVSSRVRVNVRNNLDAA